MRSTAGFPGWPRHMALDHMPARRWRPVLQIVPPRESKHAAVTHSKATDAQRAPKARPATLCRKGRLLAGEGVASARGILVRSSSSGFRYNTAMASISIRNSGAASAETATSVCAGIFFPKNSSRIGP